MTVLRFVGSVAVAAGLLAGCANPDGAARPTTHKVIIEGMRFQPEVLKVKAGDSIVWINNDPFPHTATSQAGGFDSKLLNAGGSWTYVADKKGEFGYTCTFHITMKAKLVVN
jgi:plastocyanin